MSMSNKLDIKRCWVIGAGVMGSSLAAVLHGQGGTETRLVGRSPNLIAIRENGLSLQIREEETRLVRLAADLPEEVPALGENDLVVLAGKATGLENTAQWLAPKLSAGTPVVALQNGMGIAEMLLNLLGCRVERGFFQMGATSLGPGKVRMFPRLVVMQDLPACRALASLLKGSVIACELASDYRKRAWFKLAVNCVANPLAGILDCGNDKLMQDNLNDVKQAILDEVLTVARAEGVELEFSAKDWNEYVLPGNIPSLRVDLKRGLATEIDTLNGAVVKFGQKHGLDTPVNKVLVGMVHFLS